MVGLIIESLILSILILILITLILDEKRLKALRAQSGKVLEFWDGMERRTSIRISSIINTRYSINHKKKNSISKNISIGGILMQLNEKLSKTTPLRLDIILPNERDPILARGVVVWVRELSHMDEVGRRVFDTGIKFTSMDPKDKEKLDRHIKGLT